MKNCMRYFNYISLCTSFMMIAVMVFGYLTNNLMLCNGLFALLKMCIMTCVKVLTIFITKLYEMDRNIYILEMVNEGLLAQTLVFSPRREIYKGCYETNDKIKIYI